MRSSVFAFVLFLAAHTVAVAQTTRATVLATGDSFTRRSLCSDYPTYDLCDQAFGIKHDVSYSTYLNAVTAYQVVPVDNSARGGETCITPTPFSPHYQMGPGPWYMSPRGLLGQVSGRINIRQADTVSLLIGINDLNMLAASGSELSGCLQQLYYAISVTGGKKLLVLTYPPISSSNGVWGAGLGAITSANVDIVNAVIRNAVAMHNASYTSSKIHLVDTATTWSSSEVGLYTSADGVHPNQAGALLLARKWYSSVCGPSYLSCVAGY